MSGLVSFHYHGITVPQTKPWWLVTVGIGATTADGATAYTLLSNIDQRYLISSLFPGASMGSGAIALPQEELNVACALASLTQRGDDWIDVSSQTAVRFSCEDYNCATMVSLPFPIHQHCAPIYGLYIYPSGLVAASADISSLDVLSACADGAICPFWSDWSQYNYTVHVSLGFVGALPNRVGAISWNFLQDGVLEPAYAIVFAHRAL